MPQIDLTVSISVILALVATISPILTSIINNMHHTKIRKLELRQEHLKNTVYHQRNTLESYLKYAGRCIARADSDALKEYNEYYFSALLYACPELRPDMIAIHDLMEKFDWDAATPLFENLIPKIHDYLQEL